MFLECIHECNNIKTQLIEPLEPSRTQRCRNKMSFPSLPAVTSCPVDAFCTKSVQQWYHPDSLSKHIYYTSHVSLSKHTFPFLYLRFFCPCFLLHLITATHPLLSTRLSGLADYGGQSLSTTGTGLDVFTSTCVAQPGWLNMTLQCFNFVHLAWNLHIDMSFSYLWTSLSFWLWLECHVFESMSTRLDMLGLIIQKRLFLLDFFF